MTARVIVVGSLNVDLVVMVERLPGPGETVIGGRFERHHGGKGGNQAVASARLGAPTWFVGAVGADDFGAAARNVLIAEGIDVSQLRTIDPEPTGVALILVDRDGENSIAVAGGANAAITPEQVWAALSRLAPTEGDVVLVGHEIPTQAAVAALRAARNGGATTILNPAPAAGLSDDALSFVDVVTPNRGEAVELSGSDGEPETIARALRARLPPASAVLLTLGPGGALLAGPAGSVRIAAAPVDAVDTVGAGDTVNGALAAGLVGGLGLELAARRAVLAAGLAVTRAGAREGMPTRPELEAAAT